MRRSEREIADKCDIIEVIDKCDVCRIALSQNNIPYIVPMNFGYEYINGSLTIYFHCAKEGKKTDIIKENPAACFEMDCSRNLIYSDTACKCSMEYESVIGIGNIIALVDDSDVEEKRKALSLIMKNYAPEKTFEFSEAYFTSEMINSVTILKLTVDDFTGKRYMKK